MRSSGGFGALRCGIGRVAAVMLLGGLLALLLAACQTPAISAGARRRRRPPDYDYHIGPLDTVNIIVWRNPELSMSRAGASGRQDHDAAGRRPARARQDADRSSQRDIEKALGKYIRDPVVTVVVTTFVGPANEQIRVIGEATKPQVLPYRKNMTVLDVMIAVGGLTDFADGNGARIFRVADGGKLVQRAAARSRQARRHHGQRRHAARATS